MNLFQFMTLSSLIISLVSCSGGSSDSAGSAGTFTLSSASIENGGTLPDGLKCESNGGSGLSPALSWSNIPSGAVEFAIVMFHYPDGVDTATGTPSQYWLLWDIPATANSLSAGNTESVGTEGSNKDGVETGYTSPCSPAGSVKSYTIRIYALSGEPALSGSDDVSVNYTAFTAAMTDITLGYADLTFTN